MKKPVILAVLVLMVVLVSIYIYASFLPSYTTDDIEDYNSYEYPFCDIAERIFPDEIPESAEVVKYFYDAYHTEGGGHFEDCNIYLELRFLTIEDFYTYLSLIKEQALTSGFKLCLEEKNPYDPLYMDLFYNLENEYRTESYYEIRPYKRRYAALAEFSVVSYSEENLTVIHAHASGSFGADDITYLNRFGVPTDKEHKRSCE